MSGRGSNNAVADEAQLSRMAALGVREADLEESFVRSGGHGGQNVNKTSTCVVLLHRPSGILVKCQTSRQQAYNRWLARERLLDQLARRREQAQAAERSRVEKLRRQKRPRSAASKQRSLRDKVHRARTKDARRRVTSE